MAIARRGWTRFARYPTPSCGVCRLSIVRAPMSGVTPCFKAQRLTMSTGHLGDEYVHALGVRGGELVGLAVASPDEGESIPVQPVGGGAVHAVGTPPVGHLRSQLHHNPGARLGEPRRPGIAAHEDDSHLVRAEWLGLWEVVVVVLYRGRRLEVGRVETPVPGAAATLQSLAMQASTSFS